MGKWIKTYRVFTLPLYRLLMLLAAPIALAALGTVMFEVIPAVLYIVLDVIADYWVFGGICSKYSEKLDYVKSSWRGKALMRRGLRLDRARSFLELVVIFALIAAARMILGTSVDWKMDSIALLIAYTMATLALNLSRYAETTQLMLLAAYLASVLGALWYAVCYYLSACMPAILLVLLLAVAAVLVSLLTEKHMMYRIKKSYMDGGTLE